MDSCAWGQRNEHQGLFAWGQRRIYVGGFLQEVGLNAKLLSCVIVRGPAREKRIKKVEYRVYRLSLLDQYLSSFLPIIEIASPKWKPRNIF